MIEKEGGSAPALAQRFWDEIAEPGYRIAAQLPDRQLNTDGPAGGTPRRWPFLVGAVINVRRAEWTFGQLALGVPQERLVQVIVRVLQALARAQPDEG